MAFSHDQLPPGVERVQGWVLEIEGRPSLRTVVDIKYGLVTGERFVVPGDPRTEAGYHAVVARRCVAAVQRAAPGVPHPLGASIHWLTELRKLGAPSLRRERGCPRPGALSGPDAGRSAEPADSDSAGWAVIWRVASTS